MKKTIIRALNSTIQSESRDINGIYTLISCLWNKESRRIMKERLFNKNKWRLR